MVDLKRVSGDVMKDGSCAREGDLAAILVLFKELSAMRPALISTGG